MINGRKYVHTHMHSRVVREEIILCINWSYDYLIFVFFLADELVFVLFRLHMTVMGNGV